jgi:hypothetical protein
MYEGSNQKAILEVSRFFNFNYDNSFSTRLNNYRKSANK